MSGRLFGTDGCDPARAGDRVFVAEFTVVIYDRGPEPEHHRDRSLFGPWRRYVAEPQGYDAVRETAMTPWEAAYRLVANHPPLLERRWSGGTGG